MSLFKFLGIRWRGSVTTSSVTEFNPETLADSDNLVAPTATTGLESKAESPTTHPIYSDGMLILVGDRVRSHKRIDGHFYEGQVTGITSSSLLCHPVLDVPLEDSVCHCLYVVERSHETQIHQFASLEIARAKLARGEFLDARERAVLLEAVAERQIGL